MTSAAQKSSKKARNTAARLLAVQAAYQMVMNEQSAKSVLDEYLYHRAGMDLDGTEMVRPDGALFKTIIEGLSSKYNEIESVVQAQLPKEKNGSLEPLLMSVLLCGSYELFAHHDIDSPIIISDYLNVTHSFYEGGESKLINAVLDKVSKVFR